MYGLASGMTSEVSVKKLEARHYTWILFVYPLQSHKHHGKSLDNGEESKPLAVCQ